MNSTQRIAGKTRGALAALVLVALATRIALAQVPPPALELVAPAGGQPGATVRVSLEGKDLEPVRGLLFETAGISATAAAAPEPETKEAEPQEQSSERRRGGRRRDRSGEESAPPPPEWDLAIDASLAPGLYDVRIVTDAGLSAPRALHVSPLSLRDDADPDEGEPVEIEPESRVFGMIEEGWIDRFTLRATRDATYVVECYAERLDSRLDATLEVRDAGGRRLAFSADRIGKDPIAAFEARAGETYTIDLWDLTYTGTHHYELSVSSSPRALFAFPPTAPGEGGTRAVYGWNLPGGGRVGTGDAPELLERAELPLAVVAGAARFAASRDTCLLVGSTVEARIAGDASAPLVLLEDGSSNAVEVEPNDAPEAAAELPASGEVWGRFDTPGDADWYAFTATKGERYELAVVSSHLGAPCDPVLLLGALETRTEDGETRTRVRDLLFLNERVIDTSREQWLHRKLDVSRKDPARVWTAPDSGRFIVLARNRNRRGGPDAIYRLTVRRAQPDFELVAIHSDNYAGEATTLARGGSQSCDVLVCRRGGFEGEVRIEAHGLPEGVTCTPAFIAPDEGWAPLVLIATDDAPDWSGFVELRGTASIDGVEVTRTVWPAFTVYGLRETRHPTRAIRSRYTPRLPLAVRGPAPFSLALSGETLTTAPGAKLSFEAVVTRRDDFDGNVALAYQGLRERAEQNDNGERQSKATVGKDATTQTVELNLSNQLAYGQHTFVIYGSTQLEVPKKDRRERTRRHLWTVTSNPVTVTVEPPVALRIARRDTSAGLPAGGTLELPFELARLEGAGEVRVSLRLPQGVDGLTSEAVKLAADEVSGVLVVRSQRSTERELVHGVELEASTTFNGRNFTVRESLPFAIERRPAFAVRGAAMARLGALRVELTRDALLEPEAALDVELRLEGPGLPAVSGTAAFAAGQALAAALIDIASLTDQSTYGVPPELKVVLSARTSAGTFSETILAVRGEREKPTP